MSDPWLVAEDLRMAYHTGKRHVEVLQGASLSVHAGELVAVTGRSGSGKTTLLNIMGSLDRPQGGRILWGGRAILGLPAGALSRLRNRSVGFVFQFHHLLADFTALENVLMPARIAGLDPGPALGRARSLLERVGLQGRTDHRPGELSGGEQQRVAVARALMNRPRLLLADEPAGNLDRGRAEELQELLLAARDEEGLAVVVVTHDEASARRADRHLHLEDGRLRPAGPDEESAT
jgi:lipoprotein-releasing system ATP-binding protein